MNTRNGKDGSVKMVPDKKTTNKTTNKVEEPCYYPDISNTVSATECTGMMYAPPQSEAEYESYMELNSMQFPKKEDSEKI